MYSARTRKSSTVLKDGEDNTGSVNCVNRYVRRQCRALQAIGETWIKGFSGRNS